MSGGRAAAMGARLTDTARRLGVSTEGRALLAAALDAAMAPRVAARLDDHHPDYLHPARTALILMDDAGVADPDALAAAIVAETRDPALRPGAAAVATLGSRVVMLVKEVDALGHSADGSGALERLVVATPAARLIALAERLDHCRHAKFWPRGPARAEILRQAEAVYGPVAERSAERLARRFAHWAGAFARTLAREEGAGGGS